MSRSGLLVRPAFRSEPPRSETLGPEVADLARLAGFGPDAEQEMVLDAVFALDGRRRPVAMETAVVCSRQNLKTAIFKMCALGWLVLTEERLVVWSAHEFRTAQEAFRDLEELLSGTDFLRRRVRKIARAAGDEAIIMASGARVIFKTRTKGGGRGLTGDKVILDEAFALQPMHMGALLPTLSARPEPQVVYGSSAGLPDSGVLRSIRDRGRAGGDPRLAYFEWCAPPPGEACGAGDGCMHALTSPGCGCDKPELWQMANPAMGTRISAEHIAAERRALPPHEFGRERMGWWDGPAEGASPLDAAVWAQRSDPRSEIAGAVAFGFEIRPDLSSAAIAVAGRRADGLNHGEVVEYRPGTAWLTGRILELAGEWKPCVVALNASGQSSTVTKELAEQGFEIVTGGKDPSPGKRRLAVLGAREWAQACGALVKDVTNDCWRHLGQAPADTAVEGARTRVLEDAYAWSHSRSPADITPLGALTAARHGFMTYGVGGGSAPFALWG